MPLTKGRSDAAFMHYREPGLRATLHPSGVYLGVPTAQYPVKVFAELFTGSTTWRSKALPHNLRPEAAHFDEKRQEILFSWTDDQR
jgi:hypothetical protein